MKTPINGNVFDRQNASFVQVRTNAFGIQADKQPLHVKSWKWLLLLFIYLTLGVLYQNKEIISEFAGYPPETEETCDGA
ncbi:LOW QUALITY PROTEIN: hypothetical protein YC2023_090659 [Brassica napus]